MAHRPDSPHQRAILGPESPRHTPSGPTNPPLIHTRRTTDSCVSSASATSNSEGIFRLVFVYPISRPLRATWHFARPTQSASSSYGPTTPASSRGSRPSAPRIPASPPRTRSTSSWSRPTPNRTHGPATCCWTGAT